MRFMISGVHVQVTPALKDKVLEKLGKIEKYFKADTEAQVTLKVEKQRHIIEVTIPFNGTVLRAEHISDDMYEAIDEVLAILEKQIHKYRGKIIDRHRDQTLFSPEFLNTDDTEVDPQLKIQKTKRFAIKPMDEEEAVLEMELLGHSFYVFRNAETDEVNVVYKRRNGSYGLIEPEF